MNGFGPKVFHKVLSTFADQARGRPDKLTMTCDVTVPKVIMTILALSLQFTLVCRASIKPIVAR